jgi:hypothetical protein
VQQMKARFVISFNLATYRFEGALLDQSLLVVQAGSTVSTVVEGSDSGCGLVLRLRGAFLGQSGRRRLGAHGQGRQEVREALVPARLLIIIDAHGVVEALRRAARPRCPPPPAVLIPVLEKLRTVSRVRTVQGSEFRILEL